jgi:hypothetical protein
MECILIWHRVLTKKLIFVIFGVIDSSLGIKLITFSSPLIEKNQFDENGIRNLMSCKMGDYFYKLIFQYTNELST